MNYLIIPLIFIVLIIVFITWAIISSMPKTICKTCGSKVTLDYVGGCYRFPYDGRCSKCGRACVCTKEDLI